MCMRRYDLLVVGGGVCGLWLAYFASMAGGEVALVERGAAGSGATGRSAGIVTTQLNLTIDVSLTKRAIEHYSRISEICEATGLFDRRGFASVEPAWMAGASIDLLRSEGVEYDLLDVGEAKRLLGGLKIRDYESVVYTPGDGLIDVGAMVEVLKKIIRGMGVEVYEYSPCVAGKFVEGALHSVALDGGMEIEAADYALAAGPWNLEVMKRLGLGSLPVVIYACQALSIEMGGAGPSIPVYFADSHLYLRPEGAGRIIAGNGYARVLASPDECPQSADYEFVEEITAKLLSRAADAASWRIGARWSGPCSSSPDGLPILGKLDGVENVYILDGLDGYGLMRAPALAELLARLITDGEAEWYSSLFAPSRLRGMRNEGIVVELHS